jgi:hypothetical protein
MYKPSRKPARSREQIVDRISVDYMTYYPRRWNFCNHRCEKNQILQNKCLVSMLLSNLKSEESSEEEPEWATQSLWK